MSNVVRESRALYARRENYWQRLSAILALKEPLNGPLDLVRALDRGLALSALDSLVRQGYLKTSELALIAPPRTLSHRRAKGERLRPRRSGYCPCPVGSGPARS